MNNMSKKFLLRAIRRGGVKLSSSKFTGGTLEKSNELYTFLYPRKIKFAKLVGAGNDFVLIDNRVDKITSPAQLRKLACEMCDRKFGVGADGLLVLENSKSADLKMRIFNADGSQAQMCGNGVRCFAFYFSSAELKKKKSSLVLETLAGKVKAHVNGDNIRINLTQPKDLKLGISLKVRGRIIKVNFIDTGVPHAVIFVEGLEQIDVKNLGREIRYHNYFAPAGTNVNFVEVINFDTIKVRTYERGVEDETLACGTGVAAAALITALTAGAEAEKVNPLRNGIPQCRISNGVNAHTAGGEVLKVYFTRAGQAFRDVWLEGKAKLVYRGEYYV